MEIKEYKDKTIIDKEVLRLAKSNVVGEALNGMMHGIYYDVVNEATKNKKGMLIFPLTYTLSDCAGYNPYPCVQLECKMKYAMLNFPTSNVLSGAIIEKALEGIEVIKVDYPEAHCVHPTPISRIYSRDSVTTLFGDTNCTRVNLEPYVYKDENGRVQHWYLGRCPVCGKFYVCEGRSW